MYTITNIDNKKYLVCSYRDRTHKWEVVNHYPDIIKYTDKEISLLGSRLPYGIPNSLPYFTIIEGLVFVIEKCNVHTGIIIYI